MALRPAGKKEAKGGTASENAFAGQVDPPTEKALQSALRQSHSLWKQLVAKLKEELNLDGADWHSSGTKYGWSFRLQQKKRNIVYLGPRDKFFVAAFVLGDRAVAAARQSELPPRVLKMIAEAKRYAEGTGVRIEVKEPGDLDVVKTLAKIKTEN
ncbi:MAG TPA: DUF3788 domain-containing protein [Candidatus Dormibacteraeota bacterium]|nr:DUF3788 domain-containing protein [Candidatus Dormibacteraeota bacterium]